MSVPEAGWFIDPEDSDHLRWWSGEFWTEHKRPNSQPTTPVVPTAAEVEAAQYVPMASYSPTASAETVPLNRREKDKQTRRKNSFAYTGCVLSLIGFLINPLAIFSILGIVFSAIGMAKANELQGQPVTGRGIAIAGLIIGVLGIVAFAYLQGWL